MSRIICLVGAGGKTTVMYELAGKYAQQGKKVLVTTSTHIYEPSENYVESLNDARLLWQKGSYAVAGGREAGIGKLVGLSEAELKQYEAEADIVLVEADGAKGKPCKAPREGEPVILLECDTVIGVVGMDALGRSIAEACFRAEEVCTLLDTDAEHILAEADLVKLLLSDKGTRKLVGTRAYRIVLNKCDDASRQSRASLIKEGLVATGMCSDAVLLRNAEGFLEGNIWNL